MSDFVVEELILDVSKHHVLTELLNKYENSVIAGDIFAKLLRDENADNTPLYFIDKQSHDNALGKISHKKSQKFFILADLHEDLSILEPTKFSYQSENCKTIHPSTFHHTKKEDSYTPIFDINSYRANSNNVYCSIVHHVFESVESIVKSFDYTISQCAMYKKDGVFYVMRHKDFNVDAMEKNLKLFDTCLKKNYNNSALENAYDYALLGYTVDSDTALAIFKNLQEQYSDFCDFDVQAMWDDVLDRNFNNVQYTVSSFSAKYYGKAVGVVFDRLFIKKMQKFNVINKGPFVGLVKLNHPFVQKMLHHHPNKMDFELDKILEIVAKNSALNYVDDEVVKSLGWSRFVSSNSLMGQMSMNPTYDVMLLMLSKNNTFDGINNCLNFFQEISEISLNLQQNEFSLDSENNGFPNLAQWWNFVDSGYFDPSISALLTCELAKMC